MSLYFPDKRVLWGWSSSEEYRTDVESSGGREQRRLRQFNSRRSLTGTLENFDIAARQVFRDFWRKTKGQLTPFYVFAWPMVREGGAGFTRINFGGLNGALNGDGASTDFQVAFGNPLGVSANNTQIAAVYATGVSKAFTLTNNFYATGEDKVHFNAYTPTNGEVLTMDLTQGRERIPARFAADKWSDVFFESATTLSTASLAALEVFNETP